MRFLADMPEDDVQWLDLNAAEQGKSRAALLREAVALYRAMAGREGIERFFGIWAERADISDQPEAQRGHRGDWATPEQIP